MIRPPIINVMEGAAMKAARSLARDFGEVENLQVSKKGPADFVSEADRRAEEILKRELQKARPGFALLMEESGATPGDGGDDRWIVDPLDGTTNFLHGIPHFAISIAHEHRGEIVAGLIYEPLHDEAYWAEKGAGAYLNNRRIRVSGRRDMGNAILATGIPFGNRPGKRETLACIEPVMDRTAGLRRLGAASLDMAYVAAGRFEAFWEFGLSPWDIAAGIIIVREAGGFVSRIDGRTEGLLEADSILVANAELHQPVGDMLRKAVRAAKAASD
jgi:myo-inositol-1(or 4)-monophosphatase